LPRLSKLLSAAAFAALFVASAATTAAAEPALWQIKNGESTVYLFGSIHMLPSGIAWRTGMVDKAINSADVFVWEAPLSLSSMEKGNRFIMDNGILPRGKTLSHMLSPEGLKDYKEVLKKTGAEPELVNVSHPWRAWFMLETGGMRVASGEDNDRDISVFNGVDLLLQQEADKNKAPKRYLETAAGQLSFFQESLPDDHIDDFERHLHKLLTSKLKIRSLMTEWSHGNVAAIAKQNADDEMEFPLEQHKKTIFITVGAAHLAGKGSVVELLCGEGWKVQRVNGADPGSACPAGKAAMPALKVSLKP